jgi:hypothetical protein
MSKVAAFIIDGFDLWFRSADHAPAHFHVRNAGAWEIRVSILTTTSDRLDFTFKWPRVGATVPGRLQKLLRVATVAHREALLTQWESKVVVSEDY